MSKNVEINGDVMQAVMGNLHEAPRLNNVVNLNLNEKREVKFITDYQRRRINALVKELALLTGDDPMAIYKIIIADFGLMKIKELPIERYTEVKLLLEKWIGAAKELEASTSQNSAASCNPFEANQNTACRACIEKERSYVRLQRTSGVQAAALSALVIICGWLLYKLPNTADTTLLPESVCYLDGKSHSIGSRVKTYTGALQECIAASNATPAMWVPVKKNR